MLKLSPSERAPPPASQFPRPGECSPPPALQFDLPEQAQQELGWRSVPEFEPCVLESSYEEYGGKKAWVQPTHGELKPINWEQEVKDMYAAAAVPKRRSSEGWMVFPTLPSGFEEQVRDILRTEVTLVYSDTRVIGMKFPMLESRVPWKAEFLRYHATNITALQLAVGYGRKHPPIRLAVGFSETGGAPGVFYSGNIGGCLMYAHGGLRRIGVTLILQAPAGKKLSSESNRVTYECEEHCV